MDFPIYKKSEREGPLQSTTISYEPGKNRITVYRLSGNTVDDLLWISGWHFPNNNELVFKTIKRAGKLDVDVAEELLLTNKYSHANKKLFELALSSVLDGVSKFYN